MPLEVKKQSDKETSQNLSRRFLQKVKKSGILLEVRKRRFKKKAKSKQMKKRSALRRAKKQEEYNELRKLGKIGNRR